MSSPGPSPANRRRWRLALALALLVLAAAVVGGWHYRASRPAYVFQRGREALERHDWDQVEASAARLDSAGETGRAAYLRASALAARGHFVEALQALSNSSDDGKLPADASALAGRCLVELKELRLAYQQFSRALEQDPDQVDAHRGLAAVAWDLGQLTAALGHLENVLRLAPSDGRAYRLMGQIYKDLDQPGEAEAAYRNALEHELPDAVRPTVIEELAETLAKQERYKEALELLDKSPAEAPGLTARALRIKCLLQLNRTPEAEKALEQALESWPDAAPLWLLRGQIALAKGGTADAVRALERAVELAPGEDQGHYWLARAYTRAGRTAEADARMRRFKEIQAVRAKLDALQKEAMKKPWDASVRLQLYELCLKIDKPKHAAMWYQAARACSGGP